MPIQGLRDTSNFAANERPEDYRSALLYLYPNGKLPLTALTSLMKERTVTDPVFHWWEKALDDRRLALGQNIAASAAGTVEVWTLAAGSNAITFRANDIILVEETDEQVRVNADPTSNTSIQVVRGANGTVPAAVTFAGAGINPNLLCIGSAFEEGSLAPSGVNYEPTERFNYTQIFRSTLEVTRTASKTRLRTVPAIKEARRECLEYIGVDMERAFWLGVRSAGVKNGKPIRTTAGVYNQMSAANIYECPNGQMDMDTLEARLEIIFREGSNEKMIIAGNKFLSSLGQVVRKNSQYQVSVNEKEYGMKVMRITCPFGDLVIKTHPLFTQNSGGTTGGTAYYGMNTWGFVLDMAEIEYVCLQDSDLKYQGDLAAVGQDALKSGYMAECGIEVHHPSVHHLIKNFNQGLEDV